MDKETIPTYFVGHIAQARVTGAGGGRMKVVGASMGAVSVGDCVKAGRHAAREVGAQIEA